MRFLYNAINEGWTVRRRCDPDTLAVSSTSSSSPTQYVFIKTHENADEYFEESYLEKFVKENMQSQQEKPIVHNQQKQS